MQFKMFTSHSISSILETLYLVSFLNFALEINILEGLVIFVLQHVATVDFLLTEFKASKFILASIAIYSKRSRV